jgi:predicted cation transporter
VDKQICKTVKTKNKKIGKVAHMTGLIFILLLVLFLPFTVKIVERNLEIFLFIMGIGATWVSGILDSTLILKSLKDPIKITIAVLLAGFVFKWMKVPLEKTVKRISEAIPYPLFFALVVVVLGLLSSIITAIIASLVLVIIVSILRLERASEVKLVIIACFSIGLGAALTPIGEPLSTIIVSKLNEDVFFLSKLIGREVIFGILMMGIVAALFVQPQFKKTGLTPNQDSETYQEIFIRSGKIYLFVMGLTLLGAGFEPFINTYILGLHENILYWINMISAVLDNATLAAAEISPSMTDQTIKAILLGLIISGGMLIPGNIPNIISSGKLKITSSEWARFGLPFGLITMFIYFIAILGDKHF